MTPGLSVLLIVTTPAAFAQTGIRGLVPGKSSKPDVERVLGAPLRQTGESFAEYRGRSGERVLVQFRSGSPGVERIDVVYTEVADRGAALELLGLSAAAAADARSTNAAGQLEEFFAAARAALLYRSNQPSGVTRVSCSTPESFAMEMAVAPPFSGNAAAAPPSAPAVAPKPPVTIKPPSVDSPLAALRGKYAFRRSTAAADQLTIEIVDGAVEWKSARATYKLGQTGTGKTTNADGTEGEQLLQFEPVGQRTVKITFHMAAGKVTQIAYSESTDTHATSGLAFPVQ